MKLCVPFNGTVDSDNPEFYLLEKFTLNRVAKEDDNAYFVETSSPSDKWTIMEKCYEGSRYFILEVDD